MKNNLICSLAVALLVFSCSPPKVVVAPLKTEEVPLIEQPAETNKNMAPEDAFAAGKSLYENKCAKCHRLYSPTEFSKEEWRPILAKMQIKAKIDDAQTAVIYNYIVSASK